MLEALVIGIFAGYAIAIPVGPIAVLILRTGMREGLPAALAAGAGTATADLIYATVAMLAGPALASLLAPVLLPARLVAAAMLLVLAARQLRGVDFSGAPTEPARTGRTYATVLALTLLNPATVIYFASLTIGLPAISTELAAIVVVSALVASPLGAWVSVRTRTDVLMRVLAVIVVLAALRIAWSAIAG
jgi:threonine/homoserine/homoserine lactone efflux protein